MKKIIICLWGILSMFMFSCSDFLEVSSPSKYYPDDIFNKNMDDINSTLSAVYSSLMSNDTYGSAMLFKYNTDVEFKTFDNGPMDRKTGDFACYDGDRYSGDIRNTWRKVYEGIERANIFIRGVEASPLMQDPTKVKQLRHWLGEARCLRAMFYYDLVIRWGDIPFRTIPAIAFQEELNPDGVTDRDDILTFLIDDLKAAGPHMKAAAAAGVTVERASREFCYGMIARMAMARAGYSLRPDKNDTRAVGTMKQPADSMTYYRIAREYADSVMSMEAHHLTKPFRQVFTDPCNYVVNNNDDVIFEIPFLKGNSGKVGYDTGPGLPSIPNSTPDQTAHNWGKTTGGEGTLNPLYIFSFDIHDYRRDNTVSLWDYPAEGSGVPILNLGMTIRNGKWSKLWNTDGLGATSSEYTGFNFPYLRYAEILLIFAEAENVINNGPTTAAKDALKEVRTRAFPGSQHGTKVTAYVDGLTTRDAFFNALVNERAWEFGGEGMRWKDLVRWNLLSRVVYRQFKAMKVIAWRALNNSNPDGDYEDPLYADVPMEVYYRRVGIITDNPNLSANRYPSNAVQLDIAKWPYSVYVDGYKYYDDSKWFIKFADNTNANPKKEILYSFRGYIFGGTAPVGGGSTVGGNDMNAKFSDINNLPPVRYIYPIPNEIIVSGGSKITNYYGYL